ncbi:MAG: bile acid:sodium symporter family protein [Bacteroidota bacterium]
MYFKIDRFVIAIILVVFLAWMFSQWGSKTSPIPIDRISTIGISLIFFFYGLKLSPEKIKTGLKNWRLHLLVQSTTFLFFPLMVIAFYPLIRTEDGYNIWLAFLFLGALPSTVSSSVVMVSIARGNIPGAIFNASISGLLGIVITPLWMGLFLQQAKGDFNLGTIYINLIIGILIPVFIGLMMHNYWGNFAIRHSRQLSTFDKSVILLIIYKSFATSFEEKVFSSVAIIDLAIIAVATVTLFYMVFFLTGYFAARLGFNTEDRITAQFCGTKKSLIHGTVFSSILFPASFPVGIILLPVMLYHAFQIIVISIVASNLARRSEKKATPI